MKELKAYIREAKLPDVVRALRTPGATAMTVVKTVPIGADVAREYVDLSRAVAQEHFAAMSKLELVCHDDSVERYLNIIRDEHGLASVAIAWYSFRRSTMPVRICSGERGSGAL